MTKPLTGRHVLICLVGFFAFIIAVNAWFITESVRTFRGEDEQKPYLQGVAYNRTLARRAEQQRLGWHATIAADRLQRDRVRIVVAIARADGAPQSGERLNGELRHPMDENRDKPLRLKETAAGRYEGEVAGIPAGTWDVVVTAVPGQTPFEASRRLWLR
jgi:nitrogen fixation protein FixH